jgi:hypothetical protein
MKLGYIIGPFRADTPWEVEQNVRNAEQLGFAVMRLGAFPIIPHANTRFFDKQATDEFWLNGTRELLERAADFGITVEAIGLPWLHSSGSVDEVTRSAGLSIPVFHSLFDLEKWLKADQKEVQHVQV